MDPNTSTNLRLRDAKQTTLNSIPINDAKVPVVDDTKTTKKDNEQREPGRFSRAKEQCVGCCTPCLMSRNPLSKNPTIFERFRHGLMLPPHGHVATYLQFGIVCLQIWIILYALTHGEALPGGNLYSLLILFIAGVIGGYFISFIHLPPLLGMLIVGVMLRNIPGIKVIGESIDTKWSGALRKLALTVILTRAGLGLDPIKLKKLSWAVLRLAFTPCLAEALTVGIVSHFLLDFPWKWSLMLGCILGALSPAVTVPSLVSLQDRQYGVAKGIPTMLLAAGGLDNVMCVTGFSVLFGIIFSEGDLALTIIKGPVGVIVGIVYGFIMGTLLWYLPARDCSNHVFFRSLLLIGCGMVAIFGSSAVGLSGAGPLGCLTTATVAAFKWRQRRKPGETDEIAGVMGLAWIIVQHFLFGLIGAAVNISDIQPNTAALGIATLAIGLAVRSMVSFTVTLGTGFNLKERVFITLTWLAKATVQIIQRCDMLYLACYWISCELAKISMVEKLISKELVNPYGLYDNTLLMGAPPIWLYCRAIGGLALDRALEQDSPLETDVKLGTDVLTISVLAIIICAPTGATLMALLGPRFLVHGQDKEEVIVVVDSEGKQNNAIDDKTHTVNANTTFGDDAGQMTCGKGTEVEIGVTGGHRYKEKETEDMKEASKIETDCLKDEINSMPTNEIPQTKTASIETVNGQIPAMRVAESKTETVTRGVTENLEKDCATDKSTSTEDVEKQSRRPLYVSSVVVELTDNNKEEN